MTLRNRFLIAVLLFALLVASRAPALTLTDLNAGGSFVAGALTFSDFDVVLGGDLSINLASYTVGVLADGFSISGPLETGLSEFGGMLVSYSVSAASNIITGATLIAPAETAGLGAYALVSEAMLGPGASVLGTMLAFDLEGIGADDTDTLVFGAPVPLVRVTKAIILGGGEASAIPLVTQTFSSLAVHEPASVAVLMLGMAALALRYRFRS
jgi:hypothetical protein